MPENKLSDISKIKIVLESFQEGTVITHLCKRHGISRSTFYRTRKSVVTTFSMLMSRTQDRLKRQSVKRKNANGTKYRKSQYRCRFK